MLNIPYDDYVNIHKQLPIICVDCVLINNNKILLVKRLCEPMKDNWWFPGGRISKNEKLTDAVKRIVKSETGLDLVNQINYLGFAETIFNTDPFGHGCGTHTVNFLFSSNVPDLSFMRIALDDNHQDYAILDVDEIIKGEYDQYVKRFSILAKI